MERTHRHEETLRRTLVKYDYDVPSAADHFDVDESTIYRWCDEHGIDTSQSDNEEVEMCPNCGHHDIYKRKRGPARPMDDAQYYCTECKHSFDHPTVGERSHPGWSADAVLSNAIERASD